jgi:hypothetical protein
VCRIEDELERDVHVTEAARTQGLDEPRPSERLDPDFAHLVAYIEDVDWADHRDDIPTQDGGAETD